MLKSKIKIIIAISHEIFAKEFKDIETSQNCFIFKDYAELFWRNMHQKLTQVHKDFLINQIRLSKLSISEIIWKILYLTMNAL